MSQLQKQGEYFKQILQNLANDITTDDKLAAASKFNISRITVERYLKGFSPKNDLAAELIIFFHARINDRFKIVQSVIN